MTKVHLLEIQNSVYRSAVLETLNSETMHFRTYVDIKYFYYLHVRNSFLTLCHVNLKHPIYSMASFYIQKKKQTPRPLVRKGTIPTE
jgi:hypothetical protein